MKIGFISSSLGREAGQWWGWGDRDGEGGWIQGHRAVGGGSTVGEQKSGGAGNGDMEQGTQGSGGEQKRETKMIRCRSYFSAELRVILFKRYKRLAF